MVVDQHLFRFLIEAIARQGQDLLHNWLCVLRQSLSSLSANFPPFLLGAIASRFFRQLL